MLNQSNRRIAVWVSLGWISTVSLSQGQDAGDNSGNDSQAVQPEVVVTGSRIPSVNGDLNPNVTVITGKDIDDRGFRNVFDALNTITQNTGFTEGADFGNTFTPAANTISLRGLGPNHTLILINGQRIADYPVAYDGSVNFVNLSNIPSAAVDRIEVLNGGASAIYGSDAIAGVVNIILKEHAEGIDVNLKGGATEHGGGGNGRLQIVGGNRFGHLDTVFAIEVSRQEPIWAENRSFMTSTTLEGGSPTNVWSRQDLTTGSYIDPPNGCAPFATAFGGSTAIYDTGNGSTCASGKARPTYWTTQTGNQGENLYGRIKYELASDTELFGNLILGWNHIWNDTRGPNWTSDDATTGYFLNQNTGDYESWSRRISPEEIGGVQRMNKWWNDFAGNFTTGIRGGLGSTTWKYSGSYNTSVYTTHSVRPRLLAGVDSFFLGPQLGVDGGGVPIYAPDAERFSQPITPADFSSIVGASRETGNSWLQTVSLSANGQLVDLPAGALVSAAALEWGNQGFTHNPDPGIDQGVFYNSGQDDHVSGSRTRYAAAVEFGVPILRTLSAKLAGRFDEYSFAGRKRGKPTYNLSLEYRPLEQLRFHGSYATSFRAPDMNYIYQSKTLGYFASTTDYYQCALTNQPLSTCSYANQSPGANYTQLGSRNLGFENGRSFDYGIVITPIEQVELSADYWNLRIDNEVTLIDPDQLLRVESACRQGQLDPNSPQCLQALSEVQRNPANAIFDPNAITNITIYPINAAYERTDGMDFSARLRWGFRDIGQFLWTTSYTHVMSHYYQQNAKDQPLDLVRSFDNPNGASDFPDKLTTTLTWTLRNWSSTVEVDRYGELINQGQTAFLTPTAIVNLSAQYKVGNATFGVIVNNLFDTIKRDDSGGWPYYPVGYFLPYGRQGWIEVSYHFGPAG